MSVDSIVESLGSITSRTKTKVAEIEEALGLMVVHRIYLHNSALSWWLVNVAVRQSLDLANCTKSIIQITLIFFYFLN